MSTEREKIFRSPAGYYTEFRKPYPQEIFDLVHDRFQPDGQGDLLDVGCGTGQVALPLNRWFRRVVGVDLSEEMVSHARRNAIGQQVDNAEFHVMPGEDVSSLAGEFTLVTYGSALHWMDIPATLAASSSLLAPGGGVAVLGMRSIWGGESGWEQTVVRVVQRWMEQERRAGTGTFSTSIQGDVRFEDALAVAGFDVFESGNVEAHHSVDVKFILGHLYTTSYCNRDQLGDRINDFEEDMARELQQIDASGTFIWSPGVSYVFARKRG